MNALRLTILTTSAAALAACASTPDTPYPSLAIRDAERASGQYPVPQGDCAAESPGAGGPLQPAPPVPPPPPSIPARLMEQASQLEAQARAAHADFERAVPATRAAVRGAGAVGSKSWGRAEVAYVNLRSLRGRTAIPLADLDTLVATRSVAGQPVDRIVAARDAVARLVEQEDAVLVELAPNS